MTDADLRARVLAERPGLQAALDAHETETAARMVLAWATPHITFAGPPPAPISALPMSAADMFDQNFLGAHGGVFCDGAADFFRKLLELFGIESFRVDFGEATLKHSTVLVPVARDGGRRGATSCSIPRSTPR